MSNVLKEGMNQQKIQDIHENIQKQGGGFDYVTSGEHYEMVKEYYDLVNKGIIKELSNFDKYSIAQTLFNVLDIDELESVVRKGKEKEKELKERVEKEEKEKELKERTLDLSEFGF